MGSSSKNNDTAYGGQVTYLPSSLENNFGAASNLHSYYAGKLHSHTENRITQLGRTFSMKNSTGAGCVPYLVQVSVGDSWVIPLYLL